MDNNEGGALFYMDGSHLERLTYDSISVANPVISPDGTKMALSFLTEWDWDIFIYNFNEN